MIFRLITANSGKPTRHTGYKLNFWVNVAYLPLFISVTHPFLVYSLLRNTEYCPPAETNQHLLISWIYLTELSSYYFQKHFALLSLSMILPNDGKNKKNSLSGHEAPPSKKYNEVPVFSTAQPCHLADKRHISNFFDRFEDALPSLSKWLFASPSACSYFNVWDTQFNKYAFKNHHLQFFIYLKILWFSYGKEISQSTTNILCYIHKRHFILRDTHFAP